LYEPPFRSDRLSTGSEDRHVVGDPVGFEVRRSVGDAGSTSARRGGRRSPAPSRAFALRAHRSRARRDEWVTFLAWILARRCRPTDLGARSRAVPRRPDGGGACFPSTSSSPTTRPPRTSQRSRPSRSVARVREQRSRPRTLPMHSQQPPSCSWGNADRAARHSHHPAHTSNPKAMIVDTLTPQHTPPTHKTRRARARTDHSAPVANRRLRATDAVVPGGRLERQLVHPIGGLEGYSPTEVQAEQMRARGPDRPRAVTDYRSVGS
jgi:hypothetical protein